MIRIQTDYTHQRVVLREKNRILGELIYQIDTDDGWLSPIEFSHDGDYVTVVLGDRSHALDQSLTVHDRFIPSDGRVEVERTWRLPRSGSFRLLVDFRVHGEGATVGVLPGVSVCNYHSRVPAPEFGCPYSLLSLPGAVLSSDTTASGLLITGGDLDRLTPSVHLYKSERRHAVQIRCPGVTSVVRERRVVAGEPGDSSKQMPMVSRSMAGYDGAIRLSFLLVLNCSSPARALLEMENTVWGQLTRFELPFSSAEEYRRLKLAHLNRHIARDRRGVYGFRPARDERRRRGLPVRSALAPYWSMIGARALAQEGRRNAAQAYSQEAEEMCRYFLGARRIDGLVCDAYHLSEKAWGSVENGEFSAATASLRATATIGRLVIETYAELKASQRDCTDLARFAGDIAAEALDAQQDHGLWDEHGEQALVTAELISLLVRLEATRGGNSLRRAALRRVSAAFVSLLQSSATVEQVGRDRDSVVSVLRALNDLGRYLKDEAVIRQATEIGAILVSWTLSSTMTFTGSTPAGGAGLQTRGLQVCGEGRPHLSFDGFPAAYELARLHAMSGVETFATVARAIAIANFQLVGGRSKLRRLEEGAQPAEIDYAQWSSRRRDRRSDGSILGVRIGQSAWALYALTLLAENYPEMLNSRSSSS